MPRISCSFFVHQPEPADTVPMYSSTTAPHQALVIIIFVHQPEPVDTVPMYSNTSAPHQALSYNNLNMLIYRFQLKSLDLLISFWNVHVQEYVNKLLSTTIFRLIFLLFCLFYSRLFLQQILFNFYNLFTKNYTINQLTQNFPKEKCISLIYLRLTLHQKH